MHLGNETDQKFAVADRAGPLLEGDVARLLPFPQAFIGALAGEPDRPAELLLGDHDPPLPRVARGLQLCETQEGLGVLVPQHKRMTPAARVAMDHVRASLGSFLEALA
jgi:hypothetical protein